MAKSDDKKQIQQIKMSIEKAKVRIYNGKKQILRIQISIKKAIVRIYNGKKQIRKFE